MRRLPSRMGRAEPMSADGQANRSRDFLRFYSERWMALKLCLPMGWDAGVTTAEQRLEYIRAVIIERGIADELVTRGDKGREKSVTWGALFYRAYDQPLQTNETQFALTGGESR